MALIDIFKSITSKIKNISIKSSSLLFNFLNFNKEKNKTQKEIQKETKNTQKELSKFQQEIQKELKKIKQKKEIDYFYENDNTFSYIYDPEYELKKEFKDDFKYLPKFFVKNMKYKYRKFSNFDFHNTNAEEINNKMTKGEIAIYNPRTHKIEFKKKNEIETKNLFFNELNKIYYPISKKIKTTAKTDMGIIEIDTFELKHFFDYYNDSNRYFVKATQSGEKIKRILLEEIEVKNNMIVEKNNLITADIEYMTKENIKQTMRMVVKFDNKRRYTKKQIEEIIIKKMPSLIENNPKYANIILSTLKINKIFKQKIIYRRYIAGNDFLSLHDYIENKKQQNKV